MSDTEPDPLLTALSRLPPVEGSGPAEARLQRQARQAYVRRFEGSAWHATTTSLVGRAAVPVFLAGIVGIYMSWAMTAAATLLP